MEDNEPESAKQLRQEMRRGRVIVVVGAGVSRFSTGTPGWHGVVESAIDFAQEAGIASTQTVCNLRECLQASTTPSDLVDSTHAVREILIGSSSGSGAFSLWLTKYFDIPASSAQNTTLLRAILQLPSALVATTNYDKLLSLHKPGSEAVTWRQPGEVTYSLRTGQNIVHLHGAWNDPESEIFGAEDYGRIVEDEAYRSFLKTIWTAYTILFIGCSFDGMRDPDFIALLDWAAATFPNAQYTHFALVKSDNFSPEETERFLNKWKVQLVPYGADYADLVPFLESLTRPENIPVPIPPIQFRRSRFGIEHGCFSNREKTQSLDTWNGRYRQIRIRRTSCFGNPVQGITHVGYVDRQPGKVAPCLVRRTGGTLANPGSCRNDRY